MIKNYIIIIFEPPFLKFADEMSLDNQSKLYLPDEDFMSMQIDIVPKFREILIDWLHQVQNKFRLQSETIYLTVNIIDRFLSHNKTLKRTKLQLLGCVAMLIASKYFEIYPPQVDDFVRVCDKAYTRDEVIAMETTVLTTLNFRLNGIQSWSIAQEIMMKQKKIEDQETIHLVNFLLQIGLQDYPFINLYRERTTELVEAAIYVAQTTTNRPNTENIIIPTPNNDIVTSLLDMWKNIKSPSNKYNKVVDKFAAEKYKRVSTL